ncbi:MAG: energy-coupling factor ABC transporter permease, partial [Planctomycetia bacterium]
MHLPDGLLDLGTVAATTAAAVGAVGLGVAKLQRDLGSRAAPLLGVSAAFVFAAQMVNFPVFP